MPRAPNGPSPSGVAGCADVLTRGAIAASRAWSPLGLSGTPGMTVTRAIQHDPDFPTVDQRDVLRNGGAGSAAPHVGHTELVAEGGTAGVAGRTRVHRRIGATRCRRILKSDPLASGIDSQDPSTQDRAWRKDGEGKEDSAVRTPQTPPTPGVLKTTGAVAAATDKVRDRITGQGKPTD